MTRIEQRLNLISKLLIKKNQTLAIAESVTAGLLMSTFSLAPNATQFFQGGITAYNLGQKAKHLSVDPIVADKDNCVSPAICSQMAKDVASKFNSHWGIGITGYARPVPALKIRSCYAYCSIVDHASGMVHTFKIDSNDKAQLKNQKLFVDQVLKEFLNHLDSLNKTL